MSRKPLTYDHNGHTNMPISFSHLSDRDMAGKVRMLMRSDLNHEGVVVGARDRILALSKRVEELEALADPQPSSVTLEGETALGMKVTGYLDEDRRFASHWSTIPQEQKPVRLYAEEDVARRIEQLETDLKMVREAKKAEHDAYELLLKDRDQRINELEAQLIAKVAA